MVKLDFFDLRHRKDRITDSPLTKIPPDSVQMISVRFSNP